MPPPHDTLERVRLLARGPALARRGRAARFAVAAAVCAALVSGCGHKGDSRLATRAVSEPVAPAETSAAPTLVARSAPGADGGAGRWGQVDPTPPPVPVTATMELVAFPDGLRPLPGPWAADGRTLVALVVADAADGAAGLPGAGAGAAAARVWTVGVDERAALWDSGDVEDRLELAGGLAAWLADGLLALPRGRNTFVGRDGVPAASAPVSGQPRQVDVAPDGRTVLMVAPDGLWLVTGRGAARSVSGRPAAGVDAWSWRADAGALALMGRDGGLYVVDTATAAAVKVAEARGAAPGERYARPRWLADGSVLMADAVAVGDPAAGRLDHRVVDPGGGRGSSLAARVGIAPNADMPRDASAWVSSDGGWVLYPEVGRAAGGEAPARWWLLDVRSGERRTAPPMSDPTFAPAGLRVAYRVPDGGVGVWRPADDAHRHLLLDGRAPLAVTWSPSGRWLALVDAAGDLWLAATDVGAGPTRLAGGIDATLAPTFSADDTRLAVAVRDADGGLWLALLAFGIERPQQ